MTKSMNEIRSEYNSEVEAKKQVGLIYLIMVMAMDSYRHGCLNPNTLRQKYIELDLTADPIYTFVNTRYQSELVRECQKWFSTCCVKLTRFDPDQICRETNNTQNFANYMCQLVELFKTIELAEKMSESRLNT